MKDFYRTTYEHTDEQIMSQLKDMGIDETRFNKVLFASGIVLGINLSNDNTKEVNKIMAEIFTHIIKDNSL